MQASSLSLSSQLEMSSTFTEDFRAMLTLDDSKTNTQMSETAKNQKQDQQEEQEEEEEEEEEEDFSFVCLNPVGFESVISADDVFQNGQIRPVFPVFDQALLFSDYGYGDGKCGEGAGASRPLRPPLMKVFVAEDKGYASSASESDELEGSQEGGYFEWSGKSAVQMKASPETCRKSNSTGFSKRWRFRDLIHRSNSDGKDAFVFLNPSSSPETGVEKPGTAEEKKNNEGVKTKVNAVRRKTTTSSRKSAHEKLYVWNKARKEGEKRKSYLPYRQGLVGFGFFTNVNSLSRNVHPF